MQRKLPWNRPGFHIFIIFVILSMLLTACLDLDNDSENPNPTPRGTDTVPQATPGAGNTSNATAQAGPVTGTPGGTGSTAGTPSSGTPAGGTLPGSSTQTVGTPSRTGTASTGSGSSQIATVTPVPGNLQTPGATGSGSIPVTGLSPAQAFQNEYIRLYQEANPGVVNIRADVTQGMQSGVATGSGWIFDAQGHIVTNTHVVSDAQNLLVTFFDGFQATAKLIGTDPYSDLAVIQVQNLPQNVHPLRTANQDETQVGQLVVAIGSPFGLGSTMTTGIISALGRDIPALVSNFSIPQIIQTDAAINPGNSGGPLINMNGQVIGVNSQIATGGTNQSSGVGFAVPASIVNLVAPALISSGQYTWPYLGVSGTTVDLVIQQANELKVQQGAYIDDVVQGGPAAQAGLQGSRGAANVMGAQVPRGGDVVIAIDGRPTISYDALLSEIAMHKPGDTITLTILRNGQQRDVQVRLGERPAGGRSDQPSGFPGGPLR